jgi:hypothetical protein
VVQPAGSIALAAIAIGRRRVSFIGCPSPSCRTVPGSSAARASRGFVVRREGGSIGGYAGTDPVVVGHDVFETP